MSAILLFDGECNFCSASVQFIIKRDPRAYFKFASLQGEEGQKIIENLQIKTEIDSIVLVEGDQYYIESSAALKVVKRLKGLWKFFYLFWIVPSPIRNLIYRVFAKNRYKWFGKRAACMIPTPDIRKRFLDNE